MPTLDVTRVLNNPRFRDDTLILIQRAQSIGSNGRAVNAETTANFSGVVTMASGKDLERLPEGQRLHESIVVHSKVRMTAGISGRDADLVRWKSKDYTVVQTMDYSTYGNGFIRAVCQLIPMAG